MSQRKSSPSSRPRKNRLPSDARVEQESEQDARTQNGNPAEGDRPSDESESRLNPSAPPSPEAQATISTPGPSTDVPLSSAPTERRVSQADIAREAQVSRVTVSLVLSGKDETSPETRQRVLDAAKRLRYRPNLLVQGMKTGRTGLVGVIAPVALPFHGQIARGIHDALVESECVPLILFADPTVQTKTTELEQIHRLTDRRVDGIIIWPLDASVPDVHFQEIWQRSIPLVTIDRETTTHADHVGTDDELGGRLVAEHLLSLGHRRVAHLTYPRRPGPLDRRARAFADAIAARGGACRILEAVAEEQLTELEALLTGPDRPTAIFAGTDGFALRVYRVAATSGLQIPGDLSVVGYADFSFAVDLPPPLSTVRQDPYTIGRTAAKLLLARITGEAADLPPQRVHIRPELVVRDSTSAPTQP